MADNSVYQPVRRTSVIGNISDVDIKLPTTRTHHSLRIVCIFLFILLLCLLIAIISYTILKKYSTQI